MSLPLFDAFLSGDSIINITVCLVIYKVMNIIFFRKSFYQVVFVFIDSFKQVACYTQIKSAISLTC